MQNAKSKRPIIDLFGEYPRPGGEPFPCTACGACCRNVQYMPAKEDGSCIYLQEDNKCEIYETRPSICRIPTNPPLIPHENTAEICNYLQRELGIDESYRVIIHDKTRNASEDN